MKFIDPNTDFAFRRIFGSEDSKDTLVSFINTVLQLTGKRRVETVELKTPYQVPGLPILRESIIDVVCTDGPGVQYLVEIQSSKARTFADCIIRDLAKDHTFLPNEGKDPDMNDVILIAVMDFTLFEDFKPFHSIYFVPDMKTNYVPFNQFKICCLELKKFQKSEKETD